MEEKKSGKEHIVGEKRWLLPVLLGLGVALLLFGRGLPTLLGSVSQRAEQETAPTDGQDELSQYAAALERQIERLCGGVSGAGAVRAAVSFEGGFCYLYATDSDQRSDGAGGRTYSESYVTVGSGTEEGAVLLSRIPPEIRGIGIVCEGGGQASVCAEIVSLLAATYGLNTNRIYVSAGTP